jgi:hypothetical protein
MESTKTYSLGMCPVCGVEILVLMQRTTCQLVFWCPACEVAWRQPPPADEINEAKALEEVAPGGVRLPHTSEVKHLAGVVEQPDDTWRAQLARVLADR